MNVRKFTDYSAMHFALDMLMAENLPQMELYCEIGRLVCNRPEKGAAVAAAEYLQSMYPDVSGFSPRNLRRMREFWHTYGETPIITEAMKIGWSQNVVVLEAELTLQEKVWYIRAVQQLGWSKMELQRQISVGAHLIIVLDSMVEVCYTEVDNISEEISTQTKCANDQHHDETRSSDLTNEGISLFHLYGSEIFYKGICSQQFYACGGYGQPERMADETGPPGDGCILLSYARRISVCLCEDIIAGAISYTMVWRTFWKLCRSFSYIQI